MLAVAALLLAACGGDDDDGEPTARPTTRAGSAATTTASSATPRAGATASSATPLAGSSGGLTLVAGDTAGGSTTVGALADRIAAAWAGIASFRVLEMTQPAGGPFTLVVGAGPVASPAAGPTEADSYVLDEVVLPDRRRRQFVEGGNVASEIVVIGGTVYARGEFVGQYVDPALAADTWVVLEPSAIGTETPLGQVLHGMLTPIGAPLSALTPEERDLPARSVGQATTESGRTCDLYDIVQTTQTGERVEVLVAIEASGLPCAVVTSAGGQHTIAAFTDFNAPIAIDPPAEAVPWQPLPATPVGGATPAPGEATPAG